MKENIKPLVIVTARLGSSRLPGKVLMSFWNDHTLLEFLMQRLQANSATSRIKLAIPDTPENDTVADIGIKNGIPVIRGSEEDVLGRMNLCLENERVEYVARVTVDNPFTDPELFVLQWKEMIRIGADYSYCRECPKGLAADIWTHECFKRSVANAATPYEHEHANAWVWNHSDSNKILWYLPPNEYRAPDYNFSIDTEQEFRNVKAVAMRLKEPCKAKIQQLISES
jgi:spore coat polysaccharide biosynthesis protein SpsF